MRFFKSISIGVLGLIIVVFVISLFIPSKIEVERSLVINASKEIVFNQVNDLRNWEKWSPWIEFDSSLKTHFSEPASGTGASFTWSGNEKVKSGSLSILSSIPYEVILTQMNFGKNEKGNAKWLFQEDINGVLVTWNMETDMGWSPIGKIAGILMDQLIGPVFEKGLNNLREICENPKPGVEISEEHIEGFYYGVLEFQSSKQQILSEAVKMFDELPQSLGNNESPLTNVLIIKNCLENDTCNLQMGVCLEKVHFKKQGERLVFGKFDGGRTLTGVHSGPNKDIWNTIEIMNQYVSVNNLKLTGPILIKFPIHPNKILDEQLALVIYFPIQEN